jgi:hypothetical protein
MPFPPAQYRLAVTTVKGYLSDLVRQGRAEFSVAEHAAWWRTGLDTVSAAEAGKRA